MTPIRKILIAGGGSSGWMTAALLARLFQGLYEIVLVESDEIGTIGVGEATIPAIKKYNELLGLDENEFMARTQGSFKLGIQFVDWWKQGSSYIHGFGVIGQDWEWLRMHHYWLKAEQQGRAQDFAAYSINTAAALENKFVRAQTQMGDSPLSQIAHAFHFDASLFARFLSSYAQERGVRRREGKIADVTLRSDDGFIESVTMDDGEVIGADLFVDCSGFRGLFINQALGVGFDDWSHWLPCDRAIAVPCERSDNFTPYTRSTAHGAGWQWRIPLQHRTGNGHVFSTRFMDDAEAERILLANLDGAPRADPFKVDFKAGKRRELWHKNCVAVGLAGGFLEPLESTSLHLVQAGIIRLVRLLPDAGFDPATIAEFNRQTDFEYERIRDFIILHYKLTSRTDTELWRYCGAMDVPDTVTWKIEHFRRHGRLVQRDADLFGPPSWLAVHVGQGNLPQGMDPLLPLRGNDPADYLLKLEGALARAAEAMPSHADWIARHCAAA